MYQVALNLIVNAIQVLPPGGNIWLRTVADDDHVGFEVQDDGPGMSAEMQPHIFTPFFTKRRGGTGLGLAVVERIVRAHGGTVAVESAPGRGAIFRVMLAAAGYAE